MKILDCGNIESTYDSLKQILGLTRNDIERVFEQLNLDNFYKNNPSIKEPEDVFIDLFEKQVGSNWGCDYTCWFHITRTSPENKYENGLLPLNELIASIWDFLFQLIKDDFSKSNWNAFKEQHCNSNEYYKVRTEDSHQMGPFGFLIRKVAFEAHNMGNSDYLEYSEIVLNISTAFQRCYNIDLMKKYTEATKPCIVKFKDQNFQRVYVGVALCYLYCIYNKFNLFDSCNYSFSGKGHKIDTANISDTEFLEETFN